MSFFFSTVDINNWGQQCCFLFLVEFSDNFACIDSVNCYFFFSKQPIGQAIQTCLKRNAKVTTIGFFELLLPIATIGQFFFFLVDLVLPQILHVKWTITVRRKKFFFLLIQSFDCLRFFLLIQSYNERSVLHLCSFFVKQNCCVDTNSIEREEKKTMQLQKVG